MLKRVSTWSLCVCAMATIALAGTIDREFTESFDAHPGTTLKLIHGDGDVDVRPWDQNRIEVHVRYHQVSRGFGGNRDFEVDFDHKGDTVVVEGHEIGSGILIGGTRTYKYLYTVQAPPYVTLELRGDDGDVEIRDWEASIDLSSDDGDVTIDGMRGTLSVDLDDGDLDLRNCAVDTASLRLQDGDVTVRGGGGDWSVDLDDGDLVASKLAASRVRVRSEDGDIELGLVSGGPLAIDLRTDDGDVVLAVPAEASARFQFSFDDGSVQVYADNAILESQRKHYTAGVLGGGDGLIEIHTEDGDILLRTAE